MKVILIFEVSDNTENKTFGETTTKAESLHEALCKAIHEDHDDAHHWLNDNVLSIDGTQIFVDVNVS